MKTILRYGDSNTWGAHPDQSGRIDIHAGWAGILRSQLGASCHLVEQGLNGRTTVHDDPIEKAHKNGRAALPMLRRSTAAWRCPVGCSQGRSLSASGSDCA